MNNRTICTNCVMDITDSKIVFNKEGFCDHCINFLSKTKKQWEKLSIEKFKKIIESIKLNTKKKKIRI